MSNMGLNIKKEMSNMGLNFKEWFEHINDPVGFEHINDPVRCSEPVHINDPVILSGNTTSVLQVADTEHSCEFKDLLASIEPLE